LSSTAVVAITGAITTLGVAAGGWWFQWKTANEARSDARAARRFETTRDVYANLLRTCLAQWTWITDHERAIKFGEDPPSRDALLSEAQRDVMLADVYSVASPDVIALAMAFWTQGVSYESAATTFVMVRNAAGAGDATAAAMEKMESEKLKVLESFYALARCVNTELASAIAV
jgi:hypothetical protein